MRSHCRGRTRGGPLEPVQLDPVRLALQPGSPVRTPPRSAVWGISFSYFLAVASWLRITISWDRKEKPPRGWVCGG